jgi:hypothetical protein
VNRSLPAVFGFLSISLDFLEFQRPLRRMRGLYAFVTTLLSNFLDRLESNG